MGPGLCRDDRLDRVFLRMAADLVMTLIAGPGAADALPDAAAALARRLPAAGPTDWLARGVACDLPFSGRDRAAAEKIARAAVGRAAIDIIAQPVAGRRKRVLVADLESTIIENEMLDELAEFVGERARVAEITRRAMNGELDFAAALGERVALLAGLPASALAAAAARIRLTPGARALVATARAAGMRTALVSGGFTVFAERVAAELGFERIVANRLDIAGGRILGTVAAPLVTRETKRATLLALAAECAVPPAATLAVGDGANDLPMLEVAGLGVAYHAKPAVRDAARWHLDHADLSGLLYAQGYRGGDIVMR
jgi:phosphoserine phosphatase